MLLFHISYVVESGSRPILYLLL